MKELAVKSAQNSGPAVVNGGPVEKTRAETTVPDASRWPLGVSAVCGGVFVCGAHACPGGLRALRPACVVSAAPELPDTPHDARARYTRVPLLDAPDGDIYPYLDPVADMLHEVREEGGCSLVHCVAGVSRSVTLCLAFLMKYERMTLRDAYHHLKRIRPQIRPNTGFFKQLIKYEQRLFGETSVKMVYCECIDKDIPDVYEPEYRGMAWYKKRYGPIIRN